MPISLGKLFLNDWLKIHVEVSASVFYYLHKSHNNN